MLLAMVMFCISLEHSLSKAPEEITSSMTRSGYQDDIYLVGNLVLAARNWSSLVRVFAEDGHIVNLKKTEAYLPCLDDVPSSALPPDLEVLFQQISRCRGGFKCLGSAAQGRYEYFLALTNLLLHQC